MKWWKEQLPDLSVHLPQVDVCETCEAIRIALENADDDEKIQLNSELEEHQKEANSRYDYLGESRLEVELREDFEVLVLDYGKNIRLPNPKKKTQRYYFLRGYQVHTLIITSIRLKKAFYYCWHQREGDTSISATISVIMIHFNLHIISDPRIKEVRMFTDNCPGQFRNTYIPRVLAILSSRIKLEHFMLLKGHTYLDPDRNYGCISKVMKRSDIWDMDDLSEAINSRKPGRHGYTRECIELKLTDFVNYGELFN